MSCVLAFKGKTDLSWISDGRMTTINDDNHLVHEDGHSKIRILGSNQYLIGYSGNLNIMELIYNEISSYKTNNIVNELNNLSFLLKSINNKYRGSGKLDNSTAMIIGGISNKNFLYTIFPDGKVREVQQFAMIGDGSKYIHHRLVKQKYNHTGFESLIELFKESWKSEFCNKEMYLYKIDKNDFFFDYINNKISHD